MPAGGWLYVVWGDGLASARRRQQGWRSWDVWGLSDDVLGMTWACEICGVGSCFLFRAC